MKIYLIIITILTFNYTTFADFIALNKEVDNLANLTQSPVTRDIEGEPLKILPGDLKTAFYDALPYEGKPTRVFCWIGLPKNASEQSKVPGIVLVHGGGGTAFKTWVQKWNEKGFAAISIAVEGQIDDRPEKSNKQKGIFWKEHNWPGPRRSGIYHDSEKPLKDQWMYHAVADTILANSLLRSIPQIDDKKIGVMGISWGGVITSTVIGIDSRFAFAVPTYGCGALSTAANQYGRSLGNNDMYKKVWDPILRLKNVKFPVLWLSWPGDKHFPMDSLSECYKAPQSERMVSLIPGMKHGHPAGWSPPDSYAFAQSVIASGKPWCIQKNISYQENIFKVTFTSTSTMQKATLIWSSDSGVTGNRKWEKVEAKLAGNSGEWTVESEIPEKATAWFVNVNSGKLTVSSDYYQKK